MKTPDAKKKKIMIIFCISGLVFSAFMLLMSFDFNTSELLPDETVLLQQQETLESLQREAAELTAQYAAIQARQEAATTLMTSYWHPVRNGDYEVVIRERLESFAAEANIKNPNFGTPRTIKISDTVSAFETDVIFSAPLREGLAFVNAIDAMDVAVYWKRFEMSVDQRGGTNNILFTTTIRIPAVQEI